MGIRRMNQRRRKEYDVDEEELNRIEMGRRGVKKKYTYKEIDPDELQIGEAIGSGAFGKVSINYFHKANPLLKKFVFQVFKGSWRGAAVGASFCFHFSSLFF